MQPIGNDQSRRPTLPGRPVSPFAAVTHHNRPPPSLPGTISSSQSLGVPQSVPPAYLGPASSSQPPPSSGFGYRVPYRPPSQTGNTPQFPSHQLPPNSQVGYVPQSLPSPAQSFRSPHVAQTPLSSVPQHTPTMQSSFAPPPRFSPSSSVVYSSPPPPPPFRSHVPEVPTASELHSAHSRNLPPPGSNMPPPLSPGYSLPPSSLDTSYSAPSAFPMQAYQSNTPSQVPYAFNTSQGFSSREQFPHPSAGTPVGGSALQGLVEEFKSLSVKSVPGSVDPGIDIYSLPRPLNDVEPTKMVEAYPLNCHPRYLRLTTHAMPNSQSLLSRWHLPIGAIVHPLAKAPDGDEVPVINFGTMGVIRCRRCRTYVNPYVTFTDAGRKWRCNLCSLLNDVPAEYFCTLDANGRRNDTDLRPELTRGSVEFVAPTEYMVRPPMPPLYFFLIDVSITAVRCGMLETIANTIKSCLDELPGNPRTQIGFLTFDSTLHFYNLKSSLTQPQMMVVGDLDDIFVPLPDDLLVNLSDSRNVVDTFLDSLPTMFQDNVNVESALGPALKAAFMIMSQLGGKLLVFQSTLPSLGIGRLKLRGDELRIYGTDKEHTLRIPDDPFYKQMAAEFTKFQIGVDIYACNDRYCDIASLGSLSKYTGGQIYYYPSFKVDINHKQLEHDLARDLTRETAWESVMRIRCGKGVRFTTFHGHFMLRTTDLLALPAVDCDKAFAMQLSLEDTLMTSQTVYFQVALLYTSSSGERRIRVHTAAAPVVTDLAEMYRQADTGAIVSLLCRLAIEKTLSQKLDDARQFVQLKIVKALKEYRNLYVVQHRLGGRLIFPESLTFLLLYGLALCKSLSLRGGYADALLDERCAAGFTLMILSTKRMTKLLYPSLMKIDEIILETTGNSEDVNFLKRLPLSTTSLDPKGLYLFDDGFRFVVWFGTMLSAYVITSILGDLSGIHDLSKVVLVEHDNKTSKNLMKLLEGLRESEPECHKPCHFVRQGEQPRESMLLLNNLVEDQVGGMSGYLDWTIQLYRQTQQNP